MVVGKEFFNVTYKERSLDAKTAQLIHFAVSVAIGYEFGAKHHLAEARECDPQTTRLQRPSFIRCNRPPQRYATLETV
jgi:hypothetical protein